MQLDPESHCRSKIKQQIAFHFKHSRKQRGDLKERSEMLSLVLSTARSAVLSAD